MGVLLMLMTIGGLFVAVILLVAASLTRKAWLAKFTIGGVAVWLGFYAVLLVGFSMASKTRVLEVGQAKEFCGFYLDCHMHVEMTGVRTSKSLGDRVATGKFYLVGLRVFSDAKNPNIAFRLIQPNAVIPVGDESLIRRDVAAEATLPSAGVDLGREIKGRQTIEKEIVFDVPEDLRDPKLHVVEGYGIDNTLEAVLIDDEDSILHARTFFDLREQTDTAGVK